MIIFTFKANSRVWPFDLIVKNRNTEKYGSKSLMALGPKIDWFPVGWGPRPEAVVAF